VVERLPRKRKALGSVPSSEKKNQKKKKKKKKRLEQINQIMGYSSGKETAQLGEHGGTQSCFTVIVVHTDDK